MSSFWPILVEALRLDVLGTILLAVLFGGAIGFERELQGKAAGLRTNILICVGAALFTQLSVWVAGAVGDPSRIAAQIVSGVGFLGAGTILHARGQITGLTSAATIWVVAAIGVTLGSRHLFIAAGVTLLMLFVLAGLGRIEGYVQRRALVSHVRLEVQRSDTAVESILQRIREAGLQVENVETERADDHIVVQVTMRGPQRLHDAARLSLLRASGAFSLSTRE